ncbi:unnamed protein product, partial [Musa textilis]
IHGFLPFPGVYAHNSLLVGLRINILNILSSDMSHISLRRMGYSIGPM